MKKIESIIKTLLKIRPRTKEPIQLKVDRLKQRVLPMCYFDSDEGFLFI